MMKKLTVSAVIATVLASAVSFAFAAPRHAVMTMIPASFAERFQDQGISEDMGFIYRQGYVRHR
jgi:hypothetical protein